jgi:hypothetical protein
MPGQGTMYPPGAPTFNGNLMTVDTFLRTPRAVERVVQDLVAMRGFIADAIYTPGDAPGGAVVYDELLASNAFTSRDVQAIEPGSEFPIVDVGVTNPKVAEVTKWGGAALITYEARDRDNRPLLNQQLTKLRNTIVRKVDTVGMAALAAAPVITQTASADWTTTGDMISDLETARSAIDDSDMGYQADTIIANPQQRIDVRKNPALRAALPRENVAQNPVLAADLNGFLGFNNWIFTNRVAPGTVWVLSSRIIGSQRDEVPLYTRVVDQPDRERVLVMAGRRTVPIVTDPKAAVKITGA